MAGGKGKGRSWRPSESDRRDRDRRGNGRRDDFKKAVVGTIVLIKTDVTVIKTIKTSQHFKRKEDRLCYS